MARGPAFWIGLYAMGLIAVFLGFLALTMDPDLPNEAGAVGATARDATVEGLRAVYGATAQTLHAWRARYGF